MPTLNEFALATLDALSTHIAIIDTNGTIVAVNSAWRRFAQVNEAKTNVSEGSNYLAVCMKAKDNGCEEAFTLALNITAIMEGNQDLFTVEYPCHSPMEQRWFIAKVTRFTAEGATYAVIAHENITARKLAEEEVYKRTRELTLIEERQRLSRELHDSVSQALYSSNLIAESVPLVVEKNPKRALELIQQIRTLNRAALAEMRTLLYELRPDALVHTELAELIDQLLHAAEGRKRVITKLFTTDGELKLPSEVHISLYRIAQESIHNILKHSRAKHITVYLDKAIDKVALKIIDDGVGIEQGIKTSGLGLSTMKERAAIIGANLDITSQAGQGTQISIVWVQSSDLSKEATA